MVHCIRCGVISAEGKRFCRACGAQLTAVPRPLYCSSCGSELPPEDEFCRICGAVNESSRVQVFGDAQAKQASDAVVAQSHFQKTASGDAGSQRTGRLHPNLKRTPGTKRQGNRKFFRWVELIPIGIMVAMLGALAYLRPFSISGAWFEECRIVASRSGFVDSVVFSPDGHTVASTDRIGIKLWKVPSGQALKEISEDAKIGAYRIAFGPGGDLIASASLEGPLKLWSLNSGQELQTLVGKGGSLYDVAFSSDGRWLAAGGDHLFVCDLAAGRGVRTLNTGLSPLEEVTSIAFRPDGRLLASGSAFKNTDGPIKVEIWDPSGALLKTLVGPKNTDFVAVAFSPDGRSVIIGAGDRLERWDVASGTKLRSFENPAGPILAVVFRPDGRLLATGSGGENGGRGAGKIYIWDPATGRKLHEFVAHAGGVRSLAFSPDGHWLASGGFDNTFALWHQSVFR